MSQTYLRSHRLSGLVAGVALLGFFPPPAAGQEEDLTNTPRSAFDYFLHATRAGRFGDATAVFPSNSKADAETARELRAVIDDYLTVDLTKISDSPEGKKDDHLPANAEEIGRVPGTNGNEPIRMMREASTGHWVFTPATLSHVPEWYAGLRDRWIRDSLPAPLLRYGPRDVLWWQWLALIPIILCSYGLGIFLAYLVRAVLRVIARRATREFDTRLIHQLAGPLTLLAAATVADALADQLFFTQQAKALTGSLVSASMLLAVFWGLLRSIDLGIDALRGTLFAKGRPERLALLPLFSKAAKVVLGAVAIVEVLQRLGYPAASLIAGLGIGGLAVALAAQKTVENLFGSVILGVDQPFRPGDLVKVDDVVGTVETVGLRSTRIRTASRTRVTLPNGRLSDMRIESYSARDRMRVDFVLGLVQSTRVEQLRKIISEIQSYLSALPNIHSDPATVFLTAVTPNSLDISIGFSIDTTDDATFQKARQDVLLRILGIVEENGSALAMPSRAVHLTDARAKKPAGQA